MFKMIRNPIVYLIQRTTLNAQSLVFICSIFRNMYETLQASWTGLVSSKVTNVIFIPMLRHFGCFRVCFKWGSLYVSGLALKGVTVHYQGH